MGETISDLVVAAEVYALLENKHSHRGLGSDFFRQRYSFLHALLWSFGDVADEAMGESFLGSPIASGVSNFTEERIIANYLLHSLDGAKVSTQPYIDLFYREFRIFAANANITLT